MTPLTPEQFELDRLRAELEVMESELAQAELELATRAAELARFEVRYLAVVGARIARLDALRAQLADVSAAHDPDDRAAADDAKVTRHRASESAEAVDGIIPDSAPTEPFRPPDDLKQRYRWLARALHPDLATEPHEQRRRSELMTRLNAAYADDDAVAMARIEEEWRTSPDSIGGDETGAELVRAIRKVAQIQPRLAAIARERDALEASPLADLWRRSEAAARDGRDVLAELVAELDRQIADVEERLAEAHGS